MALRPTSDQTLLAGIAVWFAALVCFWWPRKRAPAVVGLTTVVAMVLIGGVLGTTALLPCRGGETRIAVAGWVLGLYVGNPPAAYQTPVCPGGPPLALQLGQIICLAATLIGALAAAAVLWQQPLGRFKARFVRDATILTGLDALTIPLLRKLAETGRPASIVVIEPDAGHPLLDEARGTGAHVMVGDPASARILLPIIAAWRGCALSYLYALRPDVADNELILATARTILDRYRPDPERQPHLIMRIDDPRHAQHWRGWHAGTSSRYFQDALSSQESTACRSGQPAGPHRGTAAAVVRRQHPGPGHAARTGPQGLGASGAQRPPRSSAGTLIPVPSRPPGTAWLRSRSNVCCSWTAARAISGASTWPLPPGR